MLECPELNWFQARRVTVGNTAINCVPCASLSSVQYSFMTETPASMVAKPKPGLIAPTSKPCPSSWTLRRKTVEVGQARDALHGWLLGKMR
jgi:hypothetical protein